VEVRGTSAPVSKSFIQMCRLPVRFDANATFRPSAEEAGRTSAAVLVVMRSASPETLRVFGSTRRLQMFSF